MAPAASGGGSRTVTRRPVPSVDMAELPLLLGHLLHGPVDDPGLLALGRLGPRLLDRFLQLALQLAVAGDPVPVEAPVLDRSHHRTPWLARVAAVPEPAPLPDLLDV